jgi:hypothetical protein
VITAHSTAPADPFEEIAHILPKLAINIGWLKLMGEALTEQKARQSTRPVTVSEQQAAHLLRKRAARIRSRQRRTATGQFLSTPRPIGRGVRVSAA